MIYARPDLVFVALLLSASAAEASTSCMTLKEAQKENPGAHLRWRGNHCWHPVESKQARKAAVPQQPARALSLAPESTLTATDAGAPAPETFPLAQISRRWPAEVMSEAITDRWPDIRAQRPAPPAALPTEATPEHHYGAAAAYTLAMLIVLAVLFWNMYAEDILQELSQRRTLFERA